MVTINMAYTSPINPPGATPLLTQDQVWAGLKRKVHHPSDFVPVITACEVVSEEGPEDGFKIVRRVTFVPGFKDHGDTVEETCLHYPPSRVDFHQPDGSSVANIVSRGADDELLLTFSFQWRHPSVEPGSEQAKEIEDKYWKMAPVAVNGSIEGIRRLVREKKV
ncbi:hypothetical protein B0J13DRAFT_81039 [Dactylonectria estremocensis]|uniref:DUF1857-domain-containing protein n=1 Tax=Dactylonectria estremocensis TaxID=1079267 RepID=A0A9P9IV88_9HYPO|nr:hypothetical protein B0J13DRAFT_81039 [Dactylonectria estremocensis]